MRNNMSAYRRLVVALVVLLCPLTAYPQRIQFDSSGNVFALGDGGAATGDYPLLVKYSPTGEVVGEYLSSGLFAAKDSVVDLKSSYGEPQMFIRNGRLRLWIAATRELYTFSPDG